MRGAGSAFLRFITPKSRYRDRQFVGSDQEYGAALERSSTVYVGNLAFFTTEEQIYEVFSRAGEIKRCASLRCLSRLCVLFSSHTTHRPGL